MGLCASVARGQTTVEQVQQENYQIRTNVEAAKAEANRQREFAEVQQKAAEVAVREAVRQRRIAEEMRREAKEAEEKAEKFKKLYDEERILSEHVIREAERLNWRPKNTRRN